MRRSRSSPYALHAAMAAALAIGVGACADSPGRDAQEAAKNTFACQLSGERLIVRFDADEARLLMPDGERVILYQIPTGSGVRYTNGTFDLRGKGMDLQIIRNGNATPLADCQPYVPPK